ncbi:cardiolipin synthase [Pusillimonas sp. NJUB218]|uniref:cardiolipin synthase n=1 Tax=Pusillimonas sp. NJUB218 TaxID=2023230 RepID=UPI000F4B1881|nr:cardiolipin synthase [Pusillimonas sp. NJUB218]ROT45998.1 cardiolipin synthase [Pusillimonas sp. NJUB218]
MTAFEALFAEYWPHVAFALSLIIGALAAIHAAMTKTDVRAAIGWVGVIMLSPFFGALLYIIAGINRTRKDQISQQRDASLRDYAEVDLPPLADVTPYSAPQFASLRTLGDRVSHFALHQDNHVQMLTGGDQTYPAMINAIDNACRSIALQTYIFDNDAEGQKIAQALARAKDRGVEIRVLIDAVGAKYSRPPITRLLKKLGIKTALFMTNPLGMRMPYANLRSHRKILVIDGKIGFTGGMNIREAFVKGDDGRPPARDTHFRFEGPIVQQLMTVFAHDWRFTTREALPYETWCAEEWAPPQPTVPARSIRSGPDRSLGSNHSMLLGALAVAQHHVRIQSPYFLPDATLLGAINTAARRGIRVDIVIPGKNNLRLVNYAMMAQIDQVIKSGCNVWVCQGSFNHSKLITIDGAWSYVGSSNLDPRSLRLNFELDIEIYSHDIALQISSIIDDEINNSEPLTLSKLSGLPFAKKLRNKVIWLASPYL